MQTFEFDKKPENKKILEAYYKALRENQNEQEKEKKEEAANED